MGQPGVGESGARRISREGEELSEAVLPAEEPLAIEINGRLVAVLMRTPGEEKALALGYCLSEGLVRSPGEVLLLHHCGSGDEEELSLLPPSGEAPAGPGNRVRLVVTAEAAARIATQPARWVFSGCGGVDASRLGGELRVGAQELRLRAEVLWGLVPAVARAQQAYRASGGIHAAALADAEGSLLALCEDVGRHNAVDKAIGAMVLGSAGDKAIGAVVLGSAGDKAIGAMALGSSRDKAIGAMALGPAGDKAAGPPPLPGQPRAAILVATGRASSDIVAKAARVGIPVVASFSSSTTLGVRLAEAAGVTLLGYLRRNRLTVYTHPERIIPAARGPLT